MKNLMSILRALTPAGPDGVPMTRSEAGAAAKKRMGTAADPASVPASVPREPVAYPSRRPRPVGARRPIYIVESVEAKQAEGRVLQMPDRMGVRNQPHGTDLDRRLAQGFEERADRRLAAGDRRAPEPVADRPAAREGELFLHLEPREPVAKPCLPNRVEVERRAAGRRFGERSRLSSSSAFDPRHAVPTHDRRGRISFVTYTFR